MNTASQYVFLSEKGIITHAAYGRPNALISMWTFGRNDKHIIHVLLMNFFNSEMDFLVRGKSGL